MGEPGEFSLRRSAVSFDLELGEKWVSLESFL